MCGILAHGVVSVISTRTDTYLPPLYLQDLTREANHTGAKRPPSGPAANFAHRIVIEKKKHSTTETLANFISGLTKKKTRSPCACPEGILPKERREAFAYPLPVYLPPAWHTTYLGSDSVINDKNASAHKEAAAFACSIRP
jgi:hypothetical protein